ncbi:MAG: type 2 isopentenyl-diphosphate Delta-isomerase [Chloroflexaceae bacterium]|nr:type 2 isopentenyl-diphosphate Delta-isomerase [Chloroflexaceae bacterium]
MPDSSPIEGRKLDHIRIVLNEDIAAKGITTGFAAYHLPHTALPELDLSEVDTTTTFLNKTVKAPLLISSMTGGAHETERINLALAEAAEYLGLAMGVGSQRAAVVDERLAYTYQVRRVAPHIPLLANLGAVQLNYGFGVEQCQRAVDMIEADALVLHLNPLQEAVQPEGDVNFKGLLARIEQICRALSVPVIAKEVGNGIGLHDARRLYDVGVRVIDVAGAGGTSWSEVERFRQKTPQAAGIAGAFAGWGIPTTEAIRQIRSAFADVTIIGSGGVRSGIDAAKALALGANMVGTARSVLGSAIHEQGSSAVIDVLQGFVTELRVAMFCSGCGDIEALQSVELLRM